MSHKANFKKQAGDQAEQRALEEYLVQGARLLARNYRAKCGELDLVLEESLPAKKKPELVFVEVRSRSANRSWDTPEESLTPGKILRIRRAAQVYLLEAGGASGWNSIRFDLAAWDGSRLKIRKNFWWY